MAETVPAALASDSHLRLRPGGVPAILIALLALGCGPLPPGADPIPGSRPGLSDDPIVVERGSIQAEAGIDAGREAGHGFSAGELLLRYGVLTAAEARLAVAFQGGGRGPATGAALEDLELSVKLRLADGGTGFRQPALAMLPQLSLPTGATRLTADAVEPGALLLAGWEWPGLVELTANLGGSLAREEDGSSIETFLALAAGRELSERVGVEMELVRVLPEGNGEADGLRHFAGGLVWLLGPHVQLDAWAGTQRSDEGTLARFVGVGVSARWPRDPRP